MAIIKRALPAAPAPTRAYREKKTVTDIVKIRKEVPKVNRHHSFTNAEKAEILAAREKGLPYSLIASKYGTTSDTIRHLVCRENKRRFK
jgi:hypothetical protein